MKRIFLLVLTLCFMSTTVFAAMTSDDKKAAFRNMTNSHAKLHDMCVRAAENFRYDHQFAGYLKYRCMMYESDRNRLMTSVYTISSDLSSEDRNNYPIYMSNLAVKLNNDEFNRYKLIIAEYCKYNAYKFARKDAGACSAERLNSLFNN